MRKQTKIKEIHISAEGLISIDQLQNFIIEAIEDKSESSTKVSPIYAKPYTRRIDNLKMSEGYQPFNLQQFDGKGNLKQHITHFIKTCNDVGTYGIYLVIEFVRSLRENAFDWYTDLEPYSIYNWERLEQEFLNRFYSTRRVVSTMELTKPRQGEYELVVDFINRWRSLSLNCKDCLSDFSSIEMCIQGLKPNTFEELANRARDMELSTTLREFQQSPVYGPHEDEDIELQSGGKSASEDDFEESMYI